MKTNISTLKTKILFFTFIILSLILITSCHDEVKSTHTYKTQYPVFLEMSAVRAADIIIEPGKELDSPGKIYIYGDYLFINEPNKGIHILDNSNPSSPFNLNFIKIEGNVDLAINSNFLYADNYVDLLTFDISDIRNIKLVKREEDVFRHLYSHHDTGVILTFKDTVLTTDSEFMWGWFGRPGFWATNDLAMASSGSRGGESQSYGQGGSMARFTLMSGHLYAVDENSLRVFDVQSADDPKHLVNIDLGWGIETIFPYKGNLFIGSMTGMYIFDASEPSLPKQIAVYQHMTACDPVVVNDTHAFVTLRSGVMCRMGENALHVLDIQKLNDPKLLKVYPMDNPHGLGLSGDYLYIAEGQHGLKSFNVQDLYNIKQLEFLKSMKSVDIIPGPKSLIVIGPDGVCQFDYSNPEKLVQLSCIKVKNPPIV